MTYSSATIDRPLAAGGSMLEAYDTVWKALWQQPYIPVATLEMCRLRLAQLHRADAELAPGASHATLSPRKRDALIAGNWVRDKQFSKAELAAIEFAEIYGQDPGAVDDGLADKIKEHYGDKGLVCLIEALGFIDGRIRLGMLFSQIESISP